MNSKTTKVLSAGALIFAFSASAQATLFFYESFEGSNWVSGNSASGVTSNSAEAAGQAGAWGVHSGSGVTVTTANSSALSYISGTVDVAGGLKYLSLASSTTDQTLQFGVAIPNVGLRSTSPFNGVNPAGLAAGNSIYFSALVRIDAGSLAGDRFQFGVTNATLGGSGTFTGVGFGGNAPLAGQITRNNAITSLTTGGNAVLGQTYLLIGRLGSDGSNFNTVDFWINPSSFTIPGAPLTSGSGAAFNNSQVTFLISSTLLDNGDRVSIDNIRMGTAWSDVVTTAIPEPSAFAALAGVGAMGAAALRRRRRG